jgi:hypothetical protein
MCEVTGSGVSTSVVVATIGSSTTAGFFLRTTFFGFGAALTAGLAALRATFFALLVFLAAFFFPAFFFATFLTLAALFLPAFFAAFFVPFFFLVAIVHLG